MKHQLIYGGSFDPPHWGHVHIAQHVQLHVPFQSVMFLPCKQGVLKHHAFASTTQRIEMLKLTLAPYPEFKIDLREINRKSPSYMVETLHSFREEAPSSSFTLLLGADAFAQLPAWYCWEDLLKLCHLLVAKRPQHEDAVLPEALLTLLKHHETQNKNDLLTQPFGAIYRFDAGEYDISSTQLREKIRAGQSIQNLVPATVEAYIQHQQLYR